jgi:type II secretory pathway component PulM
MDAAYEAMIMGSDSLYENATWFRRTARPVLAGMAVIMVLSFVFAIVRDAQYDKVEDKVIVLQTEVRSLRASSEQTAKSADKAAIAAGAAQAALDKAIADSQQQNNGSNDALRQIAEVYAACKAEGKCK